MPTTPATVTIELDADTAASLDRFLSELGGAPGYISRAGCDHALELLHAVRDGIDAARGAEVAPELPEVIDAPEGDQPAPWVTMGELFTGDHVFVRTLDSSRHLGQTYTGVVEELHAIADAAPHALSLRCYTDAPPVELHEVAVACIIRLRTSTPHPVTECAHCAANLAAAKAHAQVTGSRGCTYGGEVAGTDHTAVWDRSMLYVDGRYIG